MNEYTVEKAGRAWELKHNGLGIASFPRKALAEQAAAEFNARPQVVKSGSGWALIVEGEQVSSFRSKKAADDAARDYQAPDQAAPVDTVEVSVDLTAPVLADADIEAMDRTARYLAAKAEYEALKSWRASGGEGDRPVTPIRDWMADPSHRNGHKASTPRVRRSSVPTFDATTVTSHVCATCGEDKPVRSFPTTGESGQRGGQCRACRDAKTAAPETVGAVSDES